MVFLGEFLEIDKKIIKICDLYDAIYYICPIPIIFIYV